MVLSHNWTEVDPSCSDDSDIPDLAGMPISDAALVLRTVITTTEDEDTFSVYSPATTGRLNRVYVMPDHNSPPADNFDLQLFQHYIEAPPVFDGGAAPVTDTLDVLAGYGADLPNDENTHIGLVEDDDDIRGPLVGQLFVQDVLRLAFTGWCNQGPDQTRRAYIYLYFK